MFLCSAVFPFSLVLWIISPLLLMGCVWFPSPYSWQVDVDLARAHHETVRRFRQQQLAHGFNEEEYNRTGVPRGPVAAHVPASRSSPSSSSSSSSSSSLSIELPPIPDEIDNGTINFTCVLLFLVELLCYISWFIWSFYQVDKAAHIATVFAFLLLVVGVSVVCYLRRCALAKMLKPVLVVIREPQQRPQEADCCGDECQWVVSGLVSLAAQGPPHRHTSSPASLLSVVQQGPMLLNPFLIVLSGTFLALRFAVLLLLLHRPFPV